MSKMAEMLVNIFHRSRKQILSLLLPSSTSFMRRPEFVYFKPRIILYNIKAPLYVDDGETIYNIILPPWCDPYYFYL